MYTRESVDRQGIFGGHQGAGVVVCRMTRIEGATKAFSKGSLKFRADSRPPIRSEAVPFTESAEIIGSPYKTRSVCVSVVLAMCGRSRSYFWLVFMRVRIILDLGVLLRIWLI